MELWKEGYNIMSLRVHKEVEKWLIVETFPRDLWKAGYNIMSLRVHESVKKWENG